MINFSFNSILKTLPKLEALSYFNMESKEINEQVKIAVFREKYMKNLAARRFVEFESVDT